MERWVQVNGWSQYEVSDQGNVRSLTRTTTFSDGRHRTFQGQTLKQQPWSGNYPYWQVHFTQEGRRKTFFVHDLVVTAFYGPRPLGKECRHHDGVGTNNCATNLSWGTRSENMQDEVRHGTHTNAKKLKCKWGHRLITPNLRNMSHRSCRACARARSKVWYAVQHGIVLDKQVIADQEYERIMAIDFYALPKRNE
jgi:hypothetical protein